LFVCVAIQYYAHFDTLLTGDIAAITDFLQATATVPLNQMLPIGAKPYISPEMMATCESLYGNSTIQYTPYEAEYMDITTMDKIQTFKYNLYKKKHDLSTRPGGPIRGMPYITRETFGEMLCLDMVVDPV
jgi:hypothetical protein